MDRTLFGIDYGSKLCGNTVIAILQDNQVLFLDVDEDVDADAFIINAANHFKPGIVVMNAPLSLPGIYCNTDGCINHQFRKADQELCAVSPMVIGGLTARAIGTKHEIERNLNVQVLETISKAQAKNYDLCNQGYRKNKLGLITCRNHMSMQLSKKTRLKINDIKSWNHLDAFLSLVTAMRVVCGNVLTYGEEKEGLVYI